MQIVGRDYVTVDVPSSYECEANCPVSDQCTYSMSVDKEASADQGSLAFTLRLWVEALTLTCTARDDHTGATKTVTKKLQVLGR